MRIPYANLTDAIAAGDSEAIAIGLRLAERTVTDRLLALSGLDPIASAVLIDLLAAQDHLQQVVGPTHGVDLDWRYDGLADLLRELTVGLELVSWLVPAREREDVRWSLDRLEDAVTTLAGQP